MVALDSRFGDEGTWSEVLATDVTFWRWGWMGQVGARALLFQMVCEGEIEAELNSNQTTRNKQSNK